MLSAAGKQVREKSHEVQPLSAPLTACPAPCGTEVIYVEVAKQSIPIALWAEIRRGAEADTLM